MPIDLLNFVRKWNASQLTERSAAPQHFRDLCEALGVPHPTEVDEIGSSYTFEKHVRKAGTGEPGYADVVGRVRAESDLVVYWFEKARAHLEGKRVARAGLLAHSAFVAALIVTCSSEFRRQAASSGRGGPQLAIQRCHRSYFHDRLR